MIQAEKAQRIMQLYESDYDNFLDKLKRKRKLKKEEAKKKKAEADKAEQTHAEAEAHKKTHLAEKAKGLIDKAGGIEGAASTVQNVVKYFKTDTPSDYQVGLGDDKAKVPTEDTILGLPAIAVYVGGAFLLIAGLYGLSRLAKGSATNSPAVSGSEQILPHAA